MTYPESGHYQCHRCTMRFAIVPNFHTYGEVTWCAAPHCKTRFWHGGDDHVPLKCEVLEADLESPSGRISKLEAVLSHG